MSRGATDWRPVDPSELSQKTPKVDPGADAEVIFWDVRVEDRRSGVDFSLALTHYMRIKIFTDKGKETYSTVEIPRIGRRTISDVNGRTIKADGSVIDLTKDAIYDRELIKTKGYKLRGKTFALPNVEVGDIIEYRYKEIRDDELANYLRLSLQKEIPIWSVTYHIKPLDTSEVRYGMRTVGFNCPNPDFVKEPQGFYATSAKNVAAFKEETYMPPEDQIRSWFMVYYEEDKKIEPEKYWKDLGKRDWNTIRQELKIDSGIKQKAEELTANQKTDELKVRAIDTFCRTKVKNLQTDHEMTSAEKKAIKENHNTADTLKQMAGRGIEIDLLMVALASAAGFDARLARVPDRGTQFFNPQIPIEGLIRNYSVAVKIGEDWRFFDPSTPGLMPGRLRWQEEGVQALVSDPKAGFFVRTQFSPANDTMRRRRATLKLNEEGEVEGELEYLYTGHLARQQRDEYASLTPAQIEEDWKKTYGRYGTPTITDFKMIQLDDPALPVIARMKITVPGFATRTSKRFLLEPGFFEHNAASRLTETTRKWDVYFPYPFAEDDEVTIELPEGWVLDQPTAPKTSNLGNVGSYDARVKYTSDGRKVIYTRKFIWGKEGNIMTSAASYPQLKNIFDFVREQDHHVLTLKLKGTGDAAAK